MAVFGRMRVVGDSMMPTLCADQLVFVRPYFFWEKVKIGDIVVSCDPRNLQRKIVKRVIKCDNQGYFLAGDNKSASTDSRHFGAVQRENIKGKVVHKVLRGKY